MSKLPRGPSYSSATVRSPPTSTSTGLAIPRGLSPANNSPSANTTRKARAPPRRASLSSSMFTSPSPTLPPPPLPQPPPPLQARQKKNIWRCGDQVNIPSQNLSGTLRFLGSIDGKAGQWAGIELNEEGAGKNDGTVAGKSYFVCKPKTGIFVAPSKLERCLSSPTPTLSPNATLQRVANNSSSNTTGAARPRMATSAKHPATPSSNRRRTVSRIAPMTPSPSAGQSPIPEFPTTPNNGMYRSMRPTPSKTTRSITRPRPTSNAGSVTSNRTNTPSPSLRTNLIGRSGTPASSASDLLSHQQRRSLSHSLASPQPPPPATRMSEKPSRVAANINDAAPKRKSSGVTSNDTLERLHTRIGLLEAENRVLRLKGEQDKAHLEASHMLARDLAVTTNHNGISAASTASRNSAGVAGSKAVVDSDTLAQLENAHKQIELERQQNKDKVAELVGQIAQLKLNSPNTEDQQQQQKQLNHRIAELESELEDAVKQHSNDMLVAQETQTKLELDLANCNTELQSLQSELVQKDGELSTAQGKLDRVSLELSRTTQLHKELLDDYEQATAATQSTSSLTSQIEKLHRSLSESEEQRSLLDKNLNSLKDQLLAAQTKSERAESKLTEIEEQNAVIKQYQTSLHQIATLMDVENTSPPLKLESAIDIAEAGQQLLQSIKQSMDSQKELLRTKDELIDSLEVELGHARDHGSDDNKLRSQIEELQSNNKELTEERERLLQDQITIRDYIDQLEMETKRLVDDIEQLNLENNTLAEELKLASMHNSTTSLDINALDSKLAGEIPLPAKREDVDDEENREMAALRENHVREVSALNAKIADIQRQKDREVKELQEELSYLENMVEDRTFGQFDEHDTAISSLKEENEQLRRQLKQQQISTEPAKPSSSTSAADITAAAAAAAASTTSAETSSKDNKPVCCEICDSTDHSITECPEIKATSSTIFKQESSIDSSRPYCDNCESFSGHWTEECPHGDEMF